jgi:hypothetical protein
MNLLTLQVCKDLQENGFPQEPNSIIASGIDGDVTGGHYYICRMEGECTVNLISQDEWQDLESNKEDKYYLVKCPTLEEILYELEKSDLSNEEASAILWIAINKKKETA